MVHQVAQNKSRIIYSDMYLKHTKPHNPGKTFSQHLCFPKPSWPWGRMTENQEVYLQNLFHRTPQWSVFHAYSLHLEHLIDRKLLFIFDIAHSTMWFRISSRTIFSVFCINDFSWRLLAQFSDRSLVYPFSAHHILSRAFSMTEVCNLKWDK